MTRSVEMWRGRTDDTPIPPRVRIRVFERYGGVCQLTGRKIRPGDKWQADHRLAIINGGANAEENLWPVLVAPHMEKSKIDLAVKSKTARVHSSVFSSL